MGQHDVDELPDEDKLRAFSKAVLDDLEALEQMVAEQRFERDVRRIGAEQEMFLVDEAMRLAPVAPKILAGEHDARLVSELATFNLEANLSPPRSNVRTRILRPFAARTARARTSNCSSSVGASVRSR